jgi:hypothetical protein
MNVNPMAHQQLNEKIKGDGLQISQELSIAAVYEMFDKEMATKLQKDTWKQKLDNEVD